MMRLFLAILLMVAACARPQFVSGHPSDSDLPRKLGLSLREWDEIRAEFKDEEITRDLKPFLWARSRLTGVVEVQCIALKSESPEASGPVFFFDLRDGHWRLLREVSEWKK